MSFEGNDYMVAWDASDTPTVVVGPWPDMILILAARITEPPISTLHRNHAAVLNQVATQVQKPCPLPFVT